MTASFVLIPIGRKKDFSLQLKMRMIQVPMYNFAENEIVMNFKTAIINYFNDFLVHDTYQFHFSYF